MVLEYRPPTSGWESTLRPTWAEISLDALRQNARNLAALASPASLMAVVKGDAYGHGAVPVSRAVLEAGASWIGVAALEEAIELRRAGITAPILVISATTPAQAETIVSMDITAAVADPEAAQALAHAGRKLGRPAVAHLKVDTGMGRLGLTPDKAGAEAAARMAKLEGLSLTGVYTHFASADEADKSFARRQEARFEEFLEAARANGLAFAWRHASNSAALIDLPEARHNLVRAGIALYGHYPSDEVAKQRVSLAPVMIWKSRLVFVKPVSAGTPIGYGSGHVTDRATLIGTVPVGYADGYHRCLGGQARVLVRGESCPVLGRVCMDHIMVSLDAVPGAAAGEEVILMGGPSGPQPGAETGGQAGRAVTAEELARACGTIAYEILSTVGRRVPRVFFEGGRPIAVRSVLGFTPIGGDAS